MSEFKNMKIQVENNLDEIVAELENRGYIEDDISNDNAKFVYTGCSGHYFKHKTDIRLISGNIVTIAELKRMK